jgi:hypothetical protein
VLAEWPSALPSAHADQQRLSPAGLVSPTTPTPGRLPPGNERTYGIEKTRQHTQDLAKFIALTAGEVRHSMFAKLILAI